MDAKSKYHNHFSQSSLVFPEIESVESVESAESTNFGILDRPTLGFSQLKLVQNRIFGPKS
jgi:hypothetical protein